MANILEPTKKY